MTIERVVLGIDPGTATLGYGVVAATEGHISFRGCGALATQPTSPLPERLLQLFLGLGDVVRQYAPTEVAVEQLFFARNVSTAMAVGQARGVVLLVAAQHGLAVAEYTPLQVKQAVAGAGRADKQRVQEMVRALLRLEFSPRPDDAADALALAICHANTAAFRERLVRAR